MSKRQMSCEANNEGEDIEVFEETVVELPEQSWWKAFCGVSATGARERVFMHAVTVSVEIAHTRPVHFLIVVALYI